MTTDRNLLDDYVNNGSQSAFGQLVERHQSFIYSTCLRELNDSAQAEDVTQVVLLLLAIKAPKLLKHTALGGWLFHTARYACKNARRNEFRRKRAELRAAEIENTCQAKAADLDHCGLELVLNRAMMSLRPADREALILRFFEDMTISETGHALGISEGAAQMRVSRATTRLRQYFSRRGLLPAGVALPDALISAHACTSAECRAALSRLALQAVPGKMPQSGGCTERMAIGVIRSMWVWKLRAALVLATALLMPVIGRVAFFKPAALNDAASTGNDRLVIAAAAARTVDRAATSQPVAGGLAPDGNAGREMNNGGPQQPSAQKKAEPQAPISEVDHSLEDDPAIRVKVAIHAEGVSLAELIAMLAAKTGVRLQVSDYVADDKVILYGPQRPMNDIMADIAALYNDVWVHSRDGDRHTYRLTRMPPARDDEDKLANIQNGRMLAHVDQQIQALNECPEQLVKRAETDPIRLALSNNENRVTTSILGLLNADQRSRLIDQWQVSLPVAALNTTQKDAIEDLFHGQRFEALRAEPLIASGAALPVDETPRDKMDTQQITFRIFNMSGADRQDSDMSIRICSPAGFSKAVSTFSTRARFVFPPHGNPYTGKKVPDASKLPDAKAYLKAMGGSLTDRLRALSDAAGLPVVADYYRSKPVLAPGDDDESAERPEVASLDNFCRPEGYLWWVRGKSLLFRKRNWYNQRLYEVPDRWVLAMSKRLQQQSGVPSIGDVLSLQELSTNQIAGLCESLGGSSDRRQLIGLPELLAAVAAMPMDKTASIHTGFVRDMRAASILPDLRDAGERELLFEFAQAFDAGMFSNTDLNEFGVLIENESKDAIASSVSLSLYTRIKDQPGIRFGYLLALPVSLPDDRRANTQILVSQK